MLTRSSLSVTTLLILALAPPLAPAAEAEPGGLFEETLRDAMVAAGLPYDPAGLVVERLVADANGMSLDRATLHEVAEEAESILGHLAASPAQDEDVRPKLVLGGIVRHEMVKYGTCSGYAVRGGQGYFVVTGGAWASGRHWSYAAQDPDVRMDLRDGETVASGVDRSIAAAGQLEVAQIVIRYGDVCVTTIGSLSGTGAFWFDREEML